MKHNIHTFFAEGFQKPQKAGNFKFKGLELHQALKQKRADLVDCINRKIADHGLTE